MALLLDGLELEDRIGEGGMGEVWRARHLASGDVVAVKWIRPERRSQRDLRPAFQREVEAMAAMDHPNIVLVYDHGTVSAGASAASGGRLEAGAPYVVLEHASGGCLDHRPPATHWDQVLPILLDTLDALAHAHARGVIHRDLKPGNLLVCGPEDARPGLKLADFGLARLTEGDSDGPRHAGTPWYMAPEQFQGRWRDLGPAVDLYSVGCLAWELVTGAVPFTHTSLTELRQHHLHAPLPELAARFGLPEGFDDWLAWCLEKTASFRPESAAAAAFALKQLGPPVDGGEMPLATPMPVRRSTPTFTWTAIEVSDEAMTGSTGPARRPRRPPLTPHWLQEHEIRPPTLLVGAGLGLFAVRPAPFTGRQSERAQLWQTLTEALDHGPRAVVVHGPEGVGCTRLARWVAERAAELGLAEPRFVRFSDGSDALDVWLDRSLQLEDLTPEARSARIGQRTADPTPLLDRERGQLDTAAAVTGWLLAEARRRPQVLVLDDAHLDSHAVALARQLLAAGTLDPAPILLVLTVPDDPGPEAARALADRLDCPALAVPRFSLEDSTHLLARTLDLEPGLAGVLHETSDGRPSLMLQTVGDWVRHGQLRTGTRGFTVDDAVATELPASLAEAWRRRAESVVAELDDDARRTVALILTSGVRPTADQTTLFRTLERDPEPAIARLVTAGFARREATTCAFVAPTAHAALRSALPAEALTWAHQQQVAWLRERGRPEERARLGQHLFALEQWMAAAEALMGAVDHRSDMGTHAISLLERASLAMDRAGLDAHSPLRHKVTLRRAALLINLGHPGAEAAVDQMIAAMNHPSATPEFRTMARKVHAQVLARFGRLEEAEALCHTIAADDPAWSATRLLLGRIALLRGQPADAAVYMQQVIDAGPALAYHRAAALTGLGDAALAAGDLELAQAHQEAAYALAVENGWRDVLTSALNLAQIEMVRGHWQTAHERLETIRRDATYKLEWFPLLAALAMRCHTAARLDLWATVDASLDLLEVVKRTIPTPDRDIAKHLASAASLADAAGHPERARRAWAFGHYHAVRLGMEHLLASHARFQPAADDA